MTPDNMRQAARAYLASAADALALSTTREAKRFERRIRGLLAADAPPDRIFDALRRDLDRSSLDERFGDAVAAVQLYRVPRVTA